MDRQQLMRNLLKADRLVLQGENHVAARRRRLGDLERYGHPTDLARELLDIFEQTLATRVADRDRLIGELTSLNQASGLSTTKALLPLNSSAQEARESRGGASASGAPE